MDYQNYFAEDLVALPTFRMWVLKPDTDAAQQWAVYLAAHPEKEAEFQKAKALILATKKHFEVISEDDAADEIEKIKSLTSAKKLNESNLGNRRSRYKYVAVAASVALLLTAAAWWLMPAQNSQQHTLKAISAVMSKPLESYWMIIENKNSQRKLIVLPDGSTLLLKKGAKVSYPSAFAKNERSVYLQGEAFFEVVKNAEQPFKIYSNSFTTEVVGTSFLLTDIPGNKNNGIAVKTGVVRVLASAFVEKNTDTEVVLELSANETWESEDGKLGDKPVVKAAKDPQNTEDIQHNTFRYRSVALLTVLSELETAYGVTFVYDRNELKDLKLSATLSDEPFFRKLDLVSMALPIAYSVKGNEIIIERIN